MDMKFKRLHFLQYLDHGIGGQLTSPLLRRLIFQLTVCDVT